MLLARGQVIYFNKANLAVDYFSGIGYKCPELCNPADYFMGIMSIESIENDMDQEDDDPQALRRSLSQVQVSYEKLIDNFSQNYQSSDLVCDHKFADPSVQPLHANDLD